MATGPQTVTDQDQDIAYPTRDGGPMGETDLHRNKMLDLIATLEDHFCGDPNIYVSGNLLVFYERVTGESTSRPTCSWSVAYPRSRCGSLLDLARGKGP